MAKRDVAWGNERESGSMTVAKLPPLRQRWRAVRRIGGTGLRRGGGGTTLKGNLPKVRKVERQRLLGPRVPAWRVKAMKPPVEGATAFSGPMGSGKTSMLLRQAHYWYLKGADVWTLGCEATFQTVHFPIDPPQWWLDGRLFAWSESANGDSTRAEARDVLDWNPLIECSRHLTERVRVAGSWEGLDWVCVCIDEAAVMCSNRDWHAFPQSFAAKLTQIRKYKIVPMYTAVFWERVDGILRDFTAWVWECQMRGASIHAECWPPDSDRTEDERPHRRIKMRLREGDVRSFDTGNIVESQTVSEAIDVAKARARRRRQKL